MEDDTCWVILNRIPQMSAADELQGGAALALRVNVHPRPSYLIVSRRISPNPITRRDYPLFLATTSSGLLLLSASQVRRPHVVDIPGRGPVRMLVSPRAYFVLYLLSATAFRLPDAPRTIGHINNLGLGLIASPRGGRHYIVADINHITGSEHAILFYFSSETLEWNEKTLRYPLTDRPWSSDGVISHDGKLWWVDLSWGLLACDPFADTPVLDVVPLPERSVLPYCHHGIDLHKYRHICVSDGELKYVEIRANCFGIPVVRMWALDDPEAGAWRLEYKKSFADIWGHESYRRKTGLPEETPVVSLVHPKNPAVVYFFLRGCLFGVNVPARRVEECAECPEFTTNIVTSRFVLAWELLL